MKSKKGGFLEKTTILWLIFGIFLIGAVFFTIQTSTTGSVLANLEVHTEKLLEENDALKRELAKSTSLKNIEEKASKNGFTKPSKIIYITGEESVAKLP